MQTFGMGASPKWVFVVRALETVKGTGAAKDELNKNVIRGLYNCLELWVCMSLDATGVPEFGDRTRWAGRPGCPPRPAAILGAA